MGKVGNGDRKRLCLGWWVHDAVCRWCFIELYTWNLHGFVTQGHPNKFNFLKKGKMCIGMDSSKFIMFVTYLLLQTCRFLSLAKFGKFAAIDFPNTFSNLSFFTSAELQAQMLDILLYSHSFWDSVHFFPVYFCPCCSDWKIYIVLSPSSMISVTSNLLVSSSTELFLQVCIHQLWNFHLLVHYNFYFFAKAF